MELFQINVRENGRDNQQLTIHSNWQHWVHKTQEEVHYNNKHNTENYKVEQHGLHKKLGVPKAPRKCKQFLPLIRHPLNFKDHSL